MSAAELTSVDAAAADDSKVKPFTLETVATANSLPVSVKLPRVLTLVNETSSPVDSPCEVDTTVTVVLPVVTVIAPAGRTAEVVSTALRLAA